MRALQPIIFQPSNKEQVKVLKAIGKAFKIEFTMSKTTTELEFTSMTEEEIIIQALKAEEEIKQGKTISHDQAYKEFKKWK